MENRIFLALDTKTVEDARQIVHEVPRLRKVKVGSQLELDPKLYEFLHVLRRMGIEVFLDFKLLDIDFTVMEAIKRRAAIGMSYTTVHANGPTMQYAVGAAWGTPLKILAVTLLTSFGPHELEQFFNYRGDPKDFVVDRAKLAFDCGCHGVICSPQEVAAVRQVVPSDFLIVTPGVRPEWSQPNDQVRTGTPAQAFRDGASAIVVGRPVIQAEDRKSAWEKLLEESKTTLMVSGNSLYS